MEKLTSLARNLRKNSTIQEKRLWNLIKNRQFKGLKFKRQCPIGDYIVDFKCVDIKLVIEIDGGQHNEVENVEYDIKRTQYLESLGYTVIRFWNNEIYENIDGVMAKLEEVIAPHLSAAQTSSPIGEGKDVNRNGFNPTNSY